MTRVLLRLLAGTITACLALLLGAAPAFAHTRLESSDPADGSDVTSAPESVSLRFNEDIAAEFVTLSVVGPDGTQYQTGVVSTAGGQITTAVSPLGPAGAYRIGYRVVSDDGHPVTGKVAFTLTAPGPGGALPTPSAALPSAAAPAPVPAPVTAAVDPQADNQQSEDAPIWPWLVGAVVLVGAGAAVALRLGRQHR
ncbi:MAG: copper resistance protein [Pseudonocardiales bacterium]|jgi:methionine-rich copper-binding protein CopC|nr:copper resistance protein [Pseudonocardiales bacterium]